ncbi:response regulator [Paraflavisolibacter sp. H34]|uniref:response regulator n=1 Tax=Huijunlia imazamoxiresistens TaxID=3127457 RepID=UPI003017B78F
MENYLILADDDPDHALLFSRILQKVTPCKTLAVAKDGDELFQLLSKQLPEILFLDLNMPCKSGLECLEQIRTTPAYQDLKVVVYSSSAHMTDIQRCLTSRADLYMVKPFASEHLKNALETVLEKTWWQKASPHHHYFMNNRFVPFTLNTAPP